MGRLEGMGKRLGKVEATEVIICVKGRWRQGMVKDVNEKGKVVGYVTNRNCVGKGRQMGREIG